jgi:hypothetical protein
MDAAVRHAVAPTISRAGTPVVINIPTATLFQCPQTSCNQGIANATNFPAHHDDVEVGFISTTFISVIGFGLGVASCD